MDEQLMSGRWNHFICVNPRLFVADFLVKN